jgi:hypothetical protein
MQGVAYTPPLEPRYSDKIPPDCNLCSLKDEADKKHQIVISGFKNKEVALAINEILVEIEGIDSEKLVELLADMKHELNKLREKKGLAPLQKTGTGSGGQ